MKISVSLDEYSVESAYERLKSTAPKLRHRHKAAAQRLAEEQALPELHSRGYGGAVAIGVEPMESGFKVYARGPAVGFLEYGTGDAAGTGEILGTPPVPVGPGTWSREHAGTYEQYKATGYPARSDGSYLYEHAPRSGMFWAMQAVKTNAETVLLEELHK